MEWKLVSTQMPLKGSGLPRSDAKETRIIHVSDVIHYVQDKIAPIKENDWDLPIAAEVGFLWEDVFSTAFAERYVTIRPGEVEKDGMVGSPDGVNFETNESITYLVDEEYKLTWRSSRKTPPDIWYWMTQFKAYCYLLGTTTTIVKVLYVMGDYRGSGPTFNEWRGTFSEYEIYDNWQMLKLNKEEMIRKGMWRFEK